MLKKVGMAVVSAGLIVSSFADAQGLYMGVGLGGTGVNNAVSNFSSVTTNTVGTGTVFTYTNTSTGSQNFSSTGFSGNIFMGYMFCLGNGFAIAPEISGIWNTARENDSFATSFVQTARSTGQQTTFASNSAEFTQKLGGTFNISVRPAYYLSTDAMIYGRIGYGWTKFNTSLNVNAPNFPASIAYSPTYLNQSNTAGGWAFGGGMEYNLTKNLGLRGDYVYTRYSSFTLSNSTTTASFRPSTNSLTLGLVYTLGTPGQIGV